MPDFSIRLMGRIGSMPQMAFRIRSSRRPGFVSKSWSLVHFPRLSGHFHLKATDKYLFSISDAGFFYTSNGTNWIDATDGLPDSIFSSSWLCVEVMDGDRKST